MAFCDIRHASWLAGQSRRICWREPSIAAAGTGVDAARRRRRDVSRRAQPDRAGSPTPTSTGGGSRTTGRRWTSTSAQDTRRLGEPDRDPAQVGALDLLDVLLRRGLGRRQPLPLHRRGAEGGAEVLPDDPAGRRGAPRGLLPPLLQRGDRRRRRHRLDPRLHRAAPRLGLHAGLQPPRQDGRRAPPRPLAAEVRAGDHALPPDRRGEHGPARPALHRGLLRPRGHDARASAPGWSTSPATSSATSASASRS